jgi:hypothetical protein
LIYEYEPISIIEITKDMLKELKEVSEWIKKIYTL